MNSGATAKSDSFGEPRVSKKITESPRDDQVLFDLRRVRPRSELTPLLQISAGNQSSTSMVWFIVSFHFALIEDEGVDKNDLMEGSRSFEDLASAASGAKSRACFL